MVQWVQLDIFLWLASQIHGAQVKSPHCWDNEGLIGGKYETKIFRTGSWTSWQTRTTGRQSTPLMINRA